MSHPQTPEAIAQAKAGNWTLLYRIFGFGYVSGLRAGASEADVLAFLAEQ